MPIIFVLKIFFVVTYACGVVASDEQAALVERVQNLLIDIGSPDYGREDLLETAGPGKPLTLVATNRLHVVTKNNRLLCLSLTNALKQKDDIARAVWVYREGDDFVHLKPDEVQSTKYLPQYELINTAGRLHTYKLSSKQSLRDALKLDLFPVVYSQACACWTADGSF